MGAHTDRVEHIFPPPAVALATLSSLVYLDFLHGTTIADWRYLLTAASRPCFAAQLTHLALRVWWEDQAVVADLLPSLPVMYPSLTHVHVGVQGKQSDEPLAVCEQWDAVQEVQAAVGGAWRDAADVVACRDDVVWRRGMGVPEPTLFPVHRWSRR